LITSFALGSVYEATSSSVVILAEMVDDAMEEVASLLFGRTCDAEMPVGSFVGRSSGPKDVVAEIKGGNQPREKQKADDYHEGMSFHTGVGWLPPGWRGYAGMVAWRGRMARGWERTSLSPHVVSKAYEK